MKLLPCALCACAVAFSGIALEAASQNYPTKAVRVVIPWPPGGSNDVVGRIVFQKMSENIGQQFVIENRGGAAGLIGMELTAKSPPDGYTIMIMRAGPSWWSPARSS